jgi:DMSO/TMAO reductase YedYZ molybdopterin-dependent catalytic subunit
MSNINHRLPPGQYIVDDLPVMHEGETPFVDLDAYRFRIFGLVKDEVKLNFSSFSALPRKEISADFHCVTRWTKLDVLWEGVSPLEIMKLIELKSEAKYIMIKSFGGYATNLSLDDFLENDVLFALKLDGEPLPSEYGGPVRLVVPRLYAWKSAKWVTGIEFISENKPGYWESRGYHMRGEPWAEERNGIININDKR